MALRHFPAGRRARGSRRRRFAGGRRGPRLPRLRLADRHGTRGADAGPTARSSPARTASPTTSRPRARRARNGSNVDLEQLMSFRKDSADASLVFTVTGLRLTAIDDNSDPPICDQRYDASRTRLRLAAVLPTPISTSWPIHDSTAPVPCVRRRDPGPTDRSGVGSLPVRRGPSLGVRRLRNKLLPGGNEMPRPGAGRA